LVRRVDLNHLAEIRDGLINLALLLDRRFLQRFEFSAALR